MTQYFIPVFLSTDNITMCSKMMQFNNKYSPNDHLWSRHADNPTSINKSGPVNAGYHYYIKRFLSCRFQNKNVKTFLIFNRHKTLSHVILNSFCCCIYHEKCLQNINALLAFSNDVRMIILITRDLKGSCTQPVYDMFNKEPLANQSCVWSYIMNKLRITTV